MTYKKYIFIKYINGNAYIAERSTIESRTARVLRIIKNNNGNCTDVGGCIYWNLAYDPVVESNDLTEITEYAMLEML